MTYLEAAHKVLSEARQPLHYNEITRRALAQHLIQPAGSTPDATMGSRLYTDTQEDNSRFVRVGKGVFELVKQRPGGIEEQVQQINRRTREQMQELLLTMPARLFESLIMSLLLKLGFDDSTLQVTPYSGDGGIDVVGVYKAAGLTEVSAAVQAKRWKGNVGAPTVTQLRGSLQVHQQGIIITTGGFSSGARKEAIAAGKTRIALIDGMHLVEMLIKNRVGAIEKRLIVDALDEEWWGELLTPVISAVQTPAQPDLGVELELLNLTVALPEPANGTTGVEAIIDVPTGRKPAAVIVLGQRIVTTSWKAVLLAVCGVLAEQNGESFAPVATTIHGRRRNYFAASSEGMITPCSVPATSLYVETNLSARDILRLSHVLLGKWGHLSAALSVEFAD